MLITEKADCMSGCYEILLTKGVRSASNGIPLTIFGNTFTTMSRLLLMSGLSRVAKYGTILLIIFRYTQNVVV